jgi:hypothetical protein
MTAGAPPRRLGAALPGVELAESRAVLRTESGVRPALRQTPGDGPLVSALVETTTGRVLEATPLAGEQLREFCAALPELFRAAAAPALVFGRLDAPAKALLKDLVLVSSTRVHVAQRLPNEGALAVASVSDRSESIGSIVSEARARLARF